MAARLLSPSVWVGSLRSWNSLLLWLVLFFLLTSIVEEIVLGLRLLLLCWGLVVLLVAAVKVLGVAILVLLWLLLLLSLGHV